MEHQLNTVYEDSLKIGLKIHKEIAKFMTNIDATDNMQINWAEIEKLTNYKYLGQTIATEKQNKTRSFDQDKSRMRMFLENPPPQRNLSGQAFSYESEKKGL